MKTFASWLLVIAVLFISAVEARQTNNVCQINQRAGRPDVNISGVKQSKFTLAGADLAGADLRNAILHDAKFCETTMPGRSFSKCGYRR